MSIEARLLEDSAEELFEDAPCGYVSTRLDGTIVKVNRTFESWTARSREELLERVRFQDLLTTGGRIYYETHYSPLLQMQGTVREIAVEVVRGDGTALPALINSTLRRDELGRPRVIRTTVFDATDRRRYEQELLRAREQEHEVALALQRSLLTGELPSSPAFELEIFYASANRGLEVGGDWYDAFWLEPPNVVGLVVGDVVGRGLKAAATMGQLRSAVRALASLRPTPGALVDALDAYSRRHAVGPMTTLVYAELNLASLELRFVCAGHLPPLIAEPDGSPGLEWGGRSLPINAYIDGGPHREASRVLSPGSLLLLYTDGVVEHRRRPASIGMDQLCDLVSEHRGEPLTALVESLVKGLHDPTHSDDRCVVAVRLADSTPARDRHG